MNIQPSLFVGPILGYDYENQLKKEMGFKILIGVKNESFNVLKDKLSVELNNQHKIKANLLYRMQNVEFFRFCFSMPLKPQRSEFTYEILSQKYKVTLPGYAEERVIDFFSCNDLATQEERDSTPDKDYMWSLYEKKIEQKALPDLLILGGDQCYFDDVWKTNELSKWILMFSKSRKEAVKIDKNRASYDNITIQFEKMKDEIEVFYLEEYHKRFTTENKFGKTLSVVPSWMTWDDHDLFDGCGSYPADIENSYVIKLIKKIARKTYFIFQQQAHPKVCFRLGEFIGSASSKVSIFGATAIVLPDTRAFRNLNQIIDPKDWHLMMRYLSANRSRFENVIVVLPIPLIYANMNGIRNAISAVDSIIPSYLIAKLPFKFAKSLNNMFNLNELLDDLDDQWLSDYHDRERELIMMDLLKLRSWGKSVVIASGDVHHGCETEIRSDADLPDDEDPYLIKNAVSSAMVNKVSVLASIIPTIFDSKENFNGLVKKIKKINFEDDTKKASASIESQNFLRISEIFSKGLNLFWYLADDEKTRLVKYQSFCPIRKVGPLKK